MRLINLAYAIGRTVLALLLLAAYCAVHENTLPPRTTIDETIQGGWRWWRAHGKRTGGGGGGGSGGGGGQHTRSLHGKPPARPMPNVLAVAATMMSKAVMVL